MIETIVQLVSVFSVSFLGAIAGYKIVSKNTDLKALDNVLLDNQKLLKMLSKGAKKARKKL